MASARTVLSAFLFGVILLISQPTAAQECGDVNAQDGITAVDALILLRKAVGHDHTLFCPDCGCTTTTTVIVTTTTLPAGTTTTTLGATTTTSTTTTSTTTTTVPDFLQGIYDGTFDGDQTGTFQFTVGPGGDVIGNGSNDGGENWVLAGTIQPNGDIQFVSAELVTSKQFDGKIRGQSANASGTWSQTTDPSTTGNWSADKQP